jgi:hypothetical protein
MRALPVMLLARPRVQSMPPQRPDHVPAELLFQRRAPSTNWNPTPWAIITNRPEAIHYACAFALSEIPFGERLLLPEAVIQTVQLQCRLCP